MIKQNILIINNQIENVNKLYALLNDMYDIQVIAGAKDIFRILNERIPDLILFDSSNPHESHELFEDLKLIDPILDIPVIFLSSDENPASQENALMAGAADYIQKPFEPVVLKARIKKQLLLREKTIKLRQMLNKKDTQLLENRVNNLLNNIDQGVLSFGYDLKVEQGYSKKTLEFFEKEPIDQNIRELLFLNDDHDRKVFNKALNMIKNSDDPSFIDMCLSILPKETTLNSRSVKLHYKALANEKFMVTIEDITDTKELENTINKQRQVQKMIVAIASNKDEFLELKSDFENFESNIKTTLRSRDDYVIFLRQIHTYKGLFSQKEMNYVVDAIHNLESNLRQISSFSPESKDKIHKLIKSAKLLDNFNKDLQNAITILGKEYFETIGKSFRLNALKNIERKIRLLLEQNIIIDSKILHTILNDILTLDLIPLYTQFISYPSLVSKTAESLGKKIYPMHIDGANNILVPSEYKNFTKTLIHVYRNCVDHGIEDPDTRAVFYKDEYGTIKTKFYKEEGKLFIEISDDGSGINLNKIIQKALKDGILTQEYINGLSEEEKLMLIFHDKVTTKDEISHISGRGVGLGAVKEELEKLNGEVRVQNNSIYGVTFQFILPLKELNSEQKEIDIVTRQSISYFKDSLFLEIKSIEAMEEYTPLNDLTAINFTGDLDAICTIESDEKLVEYLSSIMLPDNYSSEELKNMIPEIEKEILNTFVGLSINELKQFSYKNIGITVPSIINKDNYDRIINKAIVKKFVKVGTNKGDYICSFIKINEV